MTAILQIKQSDHEARVPVKTFELAGEMDSNTTEQFKKEIAQAMEAGMQYVILDFSQLGYISSAGVRTLFTLAKSLSAKSGAGNGNNANKGAFKSPYLKLFNPTPAVRQTLDMMGFTMSMEIYSDLNEALASY